ncbi:MAG: DUF3149 domain-containing protein [Pseudomonadota bacterium]
MLDVLFSTSTGVLSVFTIAFAVGMVGIMSAYFAIKSMKK